MTKGRGYHIGGGGRVLYCCTIGGGDVAPRGRLKQMTPPLLLHTFFFAVSAFRFLSEVLMMNH